MSGDEILMARQAVHGGTALTHAAHEGSVAAVRCLLEARADTALRTGMETLSQSEVGAALQVYHALGELPSAVADVAARYKRRLDEFRKTGVMEDEGVAMDADDNIYERINGEWVKN